MEKFVSNKEITDKARELVKLIKDSPLYKEYNSLKKELLKDEEVMSKINEIKTLQKEYVRSGFLDIEIEKKINNLENELKENDLYKEFVSKEVELNKILSTIKEGLNITLSNLLNVD